MKTSEQITGACPAESPFSTGEEGLAACGTRRRFQNCRRGVIISNLSSRRSRPRLSSSERVFHRAECDGHTRRAQSRARAAHAGRQEDLQEADARRLARRHRRHVDYRGVRHSWQWDWRTWCNRAHGRPFTLSWPAGSYEKCASMMAAQLMYTRAIVMTPHRLYLCRCRHRSRAD